MAINNFTWTPLIGVSTSLASADKITEEKFNLLVNTADNYIAGFCLANDAARWSANNAAQFNADLNADNTSNKTADYSTYKSYNSYNGTYYSSVYSGHCSTHNGRF